MAEVVPLKGPLGGRIEGLERGRANEPAVAALLNRALAEHLLVVIPGERMAPAQTLGLARAFGKPQTQLLRYKRSGAAPEVSIMVSTLKTDGTTDKTALRAEDWHTDDSYFATPAKATLLHGIEIEPRRGDLVLQHALGLRGAARDVAPADRRAARRPRLRHAASRHARLPGRREQGHAARADRG